MRYQLVLKFRGLSEGDEERITALLIALEKALAGSADLESFHIGNGGTNFFIWTGDPNAAFARVKPVLEDHHQLDVVTSAYRAANSKVYTAIWPASSD